MCHLDGYHLHLVKEHEASGVEPRDPHADMLIPFPAGALLAIYGFIAIVGGSLTVVAQLMRAA
jgi:hypothetical protein